MSKTVIELIEIANGSGTMELRRHWYSLWYPVTQVVYKASLDEQLEAIRHLGDSGDHRAAVFLKKLSTREGYDRGGRGYDRFSHVTNYRWCNPNANGPLREVLETWGNVFFDEQIGDSSYVWHGYEHPRHEEAKSILTAAIQRITKDLVER